MQTGFWQRITAHLFGPRPVTRMEPAKMGDSLLAHEIKNCVCTLKGSAALLLQRVDDPEQRLLVERMGRVVEKLESFAMTSKPDPRGAGDAAGRATKARVRAPVALAELAHNCFATHFPFPNLRIQLEAPPDLPPVLGDPNRLEQAFHNLFLNAMEAGAENLFLRFQCRKGSVEVSVEDDGQGCPQDALVKIFEPFFSSKVGSKGQRGLGLFIVQAILADHRCHMDVRTKEVDGSPAHGLIFTLTFPPMFATAWKGSAAEVPDRNALGGRMASAA